ncbi:MAG: thioredoxin family protein, partial [Deltaproteobacteria bacterium]|nr:thioredoxin family protein [Deltaproteobacteria bacterium]
MAALTLLSACAKSDKSPKPENNSQPTTTSKTTADSLPPKAPGKDPISWVHDDYPAALAKAKAENKPLVVDMWAPWCHTCLSMKSYVLASPTLAEQADRFVWVALDTDKEVNAAVQNKLPVDVWPTFYVVSPGDQSIQARHLGAASLDQFREFLAQGEGGHLDAIGKSGELDPKLAAMRTGDRHVVYGRYKAATAAYGKALALGGSDWKRRPEVLVANISAMYRGDMFAECAKYAIANLGDSAAGKTASAADFAYYAHLCATKVGESKAIHAKLTAAGSPVLQTLSAADHNLSLDDRSDAMRIMREVEEAAGNAEEARQWAEKQRALLDDAASKAPDEFTRMTYNWPRSEVYVYLGETEALIPELEKSVEALPDQYDPPYRLAWLQLNVGEYDKALAAADAALAKVYGPRKANVLGLLADIHRARGDKKAERKAREQVVDTYKSLPAGQERPASLARA